MRLRRPASLGTALVAAIAIAALLALAASGAQAQGSPPPAPVVYSGTLTVGGQPAPDGLQVVARILDYESRPQVTTNGRYDLLAVGPPSSLYLYRNVTFHLKGLEVQADQVALFVGGPGEETLDLTFPALASPAPTPTPAPTATLAPGVATPTPSPTALGSPPPSPVVYSGTVTMAGAPAPDGLQVVARILDYESRPQVTTNGRYDLLAVGPPSSLYLYRNVTFHLKGLEVQADQTALFVGGPGEETLDLTFPGVATPTLTPAPTATPTPTATPVSPTPTPTPAPAPTPTATAAPTATPAPTPTPSPTPAPAPTATPTAAPAVAAATVSLGLETASLGSGRESEFVVSVVVSPGQSGISGGEVVLTFPSAVLEVAELGPGGLLGARVLTGVREVDGEGGMVRLALARQGETPVPSGNGVFATVQFRVKQGAPAGSYSVVLARAALSDQAFQSVPVTMGRAATFTVGPALRGDLNADGVVDYRDLAILGAAYGSRRGDTAYRPAADLNADGVVDYRDLAVLGSQYGKRA